jgi:hypothetical protein
MALHLLPGLMHTDALPPILLIIKFQCRTLRRQEQDCGGSPWEAHEGTRFVFLEKLDILKLELNRLFLLFHFPLTVYSPMRKR